MADNNVLVGKKIRGRLRAPGSTDEVRHCGQKACTTKLSRYNRREYCYAHAPTKFPHLRGRVVSEA